MLLWQYVKGLPIGGVDDRTVVTIKCEMRNLLRKNPPDVIIGGYGHYQR